jgi:hypothetical protein
MREIQIAEFINDHACMCTSTSALKRIALHQLRVHCSKMEIARIF